MHEKGSAAVRQFIHHCQCDRTPLRPTDMQTRANMTLPLNHNTTTTHLCGQMQDFASVGVCVRVCERESVMPSLKGKLT